MNSALEAPEQDLTDWSADAPPEQLTAASELARAIDAYVEARRELAYWRRITAHWTKAQGLRVRRAGHPLDREKLEQRRRWRNYLRNATDTLRAALAACPFAGRAWSPASPIR